MIIGFDYGTSNCAVGVMNNDQPQLVELGEHGKYVPSTLYAPSRDVISHWLSQNIPAEQLPDFKKLRAMSLTKGQAALRELNLDGINPDLSFGRFALEQYLDEPDEGYYIKSPKSFLGASGLHPTQLALFEDIVAAMMANVKQLAEQSLNKAITQTVIGRPINFQGLRGEESNQQAIEVLTNAAKRVGFKDVAFQYEPVAAGFEYESTLAKETKVLVVDIGGGTTDCSMLLMGPERSKNIAREQDLLAHSGVRIGGNDFDIQLALKGVMPQLGLGSRLTSGKTMPVTCFSQAVAINNVQEQTEFYSASNRRLLQGLLRDAEQPELFSRLITAHDHKLSYCLVNAAEQAKISLTENEQHQISLAAVEQGLSSDVSRALMLSASENQLNRIGSLMDSAIEQAQCQPEVIFVTGGSAKSPMLQHYLKNKMPNCPVVVGDHFGSVTIGLARWANKLFA